MLRFFVAPSIMVLCLTSPALADDPPPVLPPPVASPASVAFDQGVALADKHKWGAALAAFRGAYALEPTPMSALHIGECELELGHYDAAEQDFRALAAATLPEGAPPAFEEARASAKERLAKMDKLGRLRVTLQGQDEGAVITVDGTPYALGEVRRVRAGKHVVRVVDRGRDATDALVDVAAGESTTAAVVVPPAQSVVLSSSDESPTAPANQGLLAGGVALTVIGGVAMVAGSFLFLFSFGFGGSQRDTVAFALPLGGGACFIAAGIPMIVVGGEKTPARQHSWGVPPPPRVSTLTFSF